MTLPGRSWADVITCYARGYQSSTDLQKRPIINWFF